MISGTFIIDLGKMKVHSSAFQLADTSSHSAITVFEISLSRWVTGVQSHKETHARPRRDAESDLNPVPTLKTESQNPKRILIRRAHNVPSAQ